jgi:dCMP deaminase
MGDYRKWDKRFLHLAEEISGWSKDPSTKCGAVIVRPNRSIASVGYNGFPAGISDDLAIYADREKKYARIIHAEINAILKCEEKPVGYTLYTVPFLTCTRCAVQVMEAGIVRVVAPALPDHLHERWKADVDVAISLYNERGVEVTTYEDFFRYATVAEKT